MYLVLSKVLMGDCSAALCRLRPPPAQVPTVCSGVVFAQPEVHRVVRTGSGLRFGLAAAGRIVHLFNRLSSARQQGKGEPNSRHRFRIRDEVRLGRQTRRVGDGTSYLYLVTCARKDFMLVLVRGTPPDWWASSARTQGYLKQPYLIDPARWNFGPACLPGGAASHWPVTPARLHRG